MIENDAKKWLESKSSQKEKIKESFSEELLLDLMYGFNREKYDKLSNQYAYKMIEEGHWEDVLNHLEKFNPTRQLFEKLLDDDCIVDPYDVEEFKWLNKNSLEKILWHEPRWIDLYDLNGVKTDFWVDKNTWMKYVIVARGFDHNWYNSDSPSEKADSFYKRIYEKYFSMNEAELHKCYWKLVRARQDEDEHEKIE